MPLIIVTGYPCSGKTYRSDQILADFQSRISSDSNANLTITHVASQHASLDPPSSETATYVAPEQKSNPRDQIYNSSPLEKTARAEEFSAIKRALTKNNVVIADGPNYIKGFRYQLWCEAKAAGTRCVVVHVATREDEVSQWNNQRLKERGWNIDDIDQEEEAHKITGPKIGRDVKGDLMPESHTAIYGDKIVDYNGGTRSRSSSMGAGASDEEDEEQEDTSRQQKKKPTPRDDTMTLKSLYISDRADSLTTSTLNSTTPHLTSSLASTESPAPSNPPPPTSSLPYSSSTLKSLLMRYEPPSPFTRWDTPLFTIPSSDPHPPYTAIWTALFPPSTSTNALSKKSKQSTISIPTSSPSATTTEVKPHAATILPKATSSSALQTLETSTGEVVKLLLSAARDQNCANGEGGVVRFSVPNVTSISTPTSTSTSDAATGQEFDQGSGSEFLITIPVNMMLTQPLLQRLRRKYTQIQRGGIAHGVGHVSGREEVVRGFVGFLEAEWED